MGADLEMTNPDHKPLIAATQRADNMAKQLLKLILDFYEYTLDFVEHYNRYHSAHKIKKFRKLLIDISGIKAEMSKYSSLRSTIENTTSQQA